MQGIAKSELSRAFFEASCECESAAEIPSGARDLQTFTAKNAKKKCWCERGDSNPHGFTRQILSLVRLPIPPLSHEAGKAVLQLLVL
jgi:hypothetical protein